MDKIVVGSRVRLFFSKKTSTGEVVAMVACHKQILAIILLDKNCRGYVDTTGAYIRMMVADTSNLEVVG